MNTHFLRLSFTLGLLTLLGGCTYSAPEAADSKRPPGPPAHDTGAEESEPEGATDSASPEDSGTQDTGEVEAVVVAGAYGGDLVITMDTQFGEDTCFGTAALDIDAGTTLSGAGSCSFSILGDQVPEFAGAVTSDGVATGTVGLEVFGSAFTLDWEGAWTESEIVADYDGSTTLDSIGSVTYNVSFELLAEQEEEPSTDVPDEGDDYTGTGTHAYSRSEGSFTTTDGCSSDYTLFTPTGDPVDVLVVLQHGFARSGENFIGWGEHLASWNVPALVVNLCHSSAWDVNIDQNGEDALEVARSITEGPLLYIGHSNGALSSLVAASLDESPVAVLGLDPVERVGGDHTGNAQALDVPVYSLLGEGGLCNTWNSGLSAYQAASDAEVLLVTEADHCDFESPTDSTCTFACGGSNALFSDTDIRSTIIGMSTAFVLWQVLDEETARQWWSPDGTIRATLEADGAISNL